MLFEAEAKTLRPRPECLDAEAETEAKFLSSKPVWPRGFNISGEWNVWTASKNEAPISGS